jgi:hypothetical protein
MHIDLPRSACAFTLAAVAVGAHAGRPLGTDDASTADPRTCQVESWVDRADGSHETVLSGACGIADGLELGVETARPSPRHDVRGSAGLALKWAPERWGADTAWGAVRFGLKAALSSDRTQPGGWRAPNPTLLGLASWAPADDWAVHANLGAQRDRASDTSAGLLALAAAWTPAEPLLLFAEALANDRSEVFGPAVRSAGARWWLMPERFGVDLVASRVSGVAGTTWSIGFGWYGIGR